MESEQCDCWAATSHLQHLSASNPLQQHSSTAAHRLNLLADPVNIRILNGSFTSTAILTAKTAAGETLRRDSHHCLCPGESHVARVTMWEVSQSGLGYLDSYNIPSDSEAKHPSDRLNFDASTQETSHSLTQSKTFDRRQHCSTDYNVTRVLDDCIRN